MDLAPIAFFAYKRPEHALRALSSLAECDLARESKLYIFCDGIKVPGDRDRVMAAREVVKSQQWCGEVEILEREENIGLAKSIISGVTKLSDKYGKVIVLEDDLLVHPKFLQYMNHALEKYQDRERVMQISGHMFPADFPCETDSFFLPSVTTWGWGTWQRAWKYLDPKLTGYDRLKKSRELRYQFDLNNSYYYYELLEDLIAGKIDAWGIVWYLSVFMQDGLTLFPKYSFIDNIGWDGSGTHCGDETIPIAEPPKNFQVKTYPERIEVTPYKKLVYQGIAKANNENYWTRFKRKVRIRSRLRALLKR
ncbi:sugar phosphate nucleotidyltransferase [Roseofilum casamattae]|uniref:Nucleotidyl transferase domain-containing protein n=1 Tax=Roseofilum casamattae BLCC-M143 TaxID=3022442 RepID=A0ABT7C2B7_9CYAN|nr:sugar phosphate nucleotidyltransferase [Roseofilum casamattae]MDJ1184821.1 hypothetical protein [Roseofilum casamattae BLCC-M143]